MATTERIPARSRLDEEGARRLAEAAHGADVEPNGGLVIDHVARVTAAVPPGARAVAWLHDVLERTPVTAMDLVDAGLSPDELGAVLLLEREGPDDDMTFLAHVREIAVAPGAAGTLARTVKLADMSDRARHPRNPAGPWRPPYAAGLRLLAACAPRADAQRPEKEE